MRPILNNALLAAILASLIGNANATSIAVNKCVVDGKVIYTEAPCADSQTIKTPDSVSAADAASAKQRAAADKTELKHVEQARAKSEAQQASAEQKSIKASASAKEKCEKLALRKKWAEEDLARASSGKSYEKIKTKAYRADQAYTLACGKPAG